MSNGAPAPEGVTERIYEITKTIKEYKIADIPDVFFPVAFVLNIGRPVHNRDKDIR
jgi:phosphoglucomutase